MDGSLRILTESSDEQKTNPTLIGKNANVNAEKDEHECIVCNRSFKTD